MLIFGRLICYSASCADIDIDFTSMAPGFADEKVHGAGRKCGSFVSIRFESRSSRAGRLPNATRLTLRAALAYDGPFARYRSIFPQVIFGAADARAVG